ncbi:MAG: phosphatidylserine decarboxylase [candidate division NC10 bacterium]
MDKIIHRLKLNFAIIILAGMILSPSAVLAENINHKPITQELIKLVKENPEIRPMLEASIAAAAKINPDKKTNPVQNLPDYYDFLDRAAGLLPQMILDSPSNLLPVRMQQGYCYLYFLIDQPLPELKENGAVRNSIQYYQPFAKWLYKFVNTYGAFLDTKESWSEEIYQEHYKDPTFGLQKEWYESPANWKTYNQFFVRFLKSPDVRPIASPNDPSVVVAPADSVPQGVWTIDEKSNIQVEGGLKVKDETYFNVENLLGKDSQYKDAFAKGVLTHTYLNVNDYHRYHFAVGGIIKEQKIVEMNVARQVRWDPKEGKYFVVHSLDWEFFQTHGYVIVDTEKYGLVAHIPVGMGLVSSVNFEKNVTVGSNHKKGDMLGYFLFGGSDVVMLFQEKAGFKITAPAEDRPVAPSGSDHGPSVTNYKHLLTGETYGVLKGQTK